MPAGIRQPIRRSIRAEATRLHERPCIAAIGLRPPRASGVHRRKVRIRHDHIVPELLEMPRDPLTLRARLDEHARRRAIPENRTEPLPARHDATLFHRSIIPPDAQLTLAFVEIESYRIHGGWPPGVCLVARR